jgi:hypothetical protein
LPAFRPAIRRIWTPGSLFAALLFHAASLHDVQSSVSCSVARVALRLIRMSLNPGTGVQTSAVYLMVTVIVL